MPSKKIGTKMQLSRDFKFSKNSSKINLLYEKHESHITMNVYYVGMYTYQITKLNLIAAILHEVYI